VTSIAVVSFADYQAGGERRARFVRQVGEALSDIGFFAVVDHGVEPDLLAGAYASARRFFALPDAVKRTYNEPARAGQRGFTPFGVEHAKDSPSPDLKEFWQVGRTDVGADHPVHARYGTNPWPTEVADFGAIYDRLYRALDGLGAGLLEACALHIGEPVGRFRDMAREGDTILRILHYPALAPETPAGAVRAAAHEDINLITLLPAATASGLELKTNDGRWVPIETSGDVIIVDAGDMLQNVTNGLYKSTTHRVVNPDDGSTDRLSIPCFIHPRGEVDLTPLASCVARTGGESRFAAITAGEYLRNRLREIGLAV
jgi:isopenicillin N synthase-like dioxygenase